MTLELCPCIYTIQADKVFPYKPSAVNDRYIYNGGFKRAESQQCQASKTHGMHLCLIGIRELCTVEYMWELVLHTCDKDCLMIFILGTILVDRRIRLGYYD